MAVDLNSLAHESCQLQVDAMEEGIELGIVVMQIA